MISWAKSFTSLEAEINQDIKNGGFLFSRYLDGIFPCKKSCIIGEKFFKQNVALRHLLKKETLLTVYVLMEICHRDSSITDWALK